MRAFRLSQLFLCMLSVRPCRCYDALRERMYLLARRTGVLRARETSVPASFYSSVLFSFFPFKEGVLSHHLRASERKTGKSNAERRKVPKQSDILHPQNHDSSTSATGLATIVSWETRQSCISVSTRLKSSFLSDGRQMRLKRVVASHL